jgi:tripartite-type tricarboxylate transporter receptor subunit TctC
MLGRLIRSVAMATALLALLVVVPLAPALAQAWPSRPIKLIVPHAPGGVTDVVARLVAQPLGEALGQSVLVENRPGASGLVGTEFVASSAPDGYTFVMFVDANTILPSTVRQLRHDPLTSFAPITLLGRGNHVLIVHPTLPVRTLPELIAWVRQRPRELSYATPGIGGPQHLAMEIIKNRTGMEMTSIAYKGGGQAIADVASGQLKLGILGMAPALPYLQSGKLYALAVTGARRAALLPDVPTVSETLPGFEAAQWQGMSAPAGTPPAIVARMHDELLRIMRSPAIGKRFAAIGMDTSTSATPAEFEAMIAAELKRWPEVVKLAGIEPQ